jgi:hypothetical protein
VLVGALSFQFCGGGRFAHSRAALYASILVLHTPANFEIRRPFAAAAPTLQRPRREAKLISGMNGLQQTHFPHRTWLLLLEGHEADAGMQQGNIFRAR